MINLKTYSLNEVPLTNEVIVSYINDFWNEIFMSLNGKYLIIII